MNLPGKTYFVKLLTTFICCFQSFFYNNSLFETTLNKHFNVKMMKETQNISLFIA